MDCQIMIFAILYTLSPNDRTNSQTPNPNFMVQGTAITLIQQTATGVPQTQANIPVYLY